MTKNYKFLKTKYKINKNKWADKTEKKILFANLRNEREVNHYRLMRQK